MTTSGGVGENCSSDGYGCGTIFKLTPGGNLTTLYSFCSLPNCPDGLPESDGLDAQGASIIQGNDGNLYGTTGAGGAIQNAYCASDIFLPGCGTIFEISLTGQFSTLYTFCAQGTCSDGATPGGLLQGTDGKFYGVTISGGITNANCNTGGCGTVFSLNTGLGPFVAFVQPFGKIGETTQILGQGFEGTTQVSLNGIPANFTVRADTSLAAVVPVGAKTGFVIVTTPTGVWKSKVPFLIVP